MVAILTVVEFCCGNNFLEMNKRKNEEDFSVVFFIIVFCYYFILVATLFLIFAFLKCFANCAAKD